MRVQPKARRVGLGGLAPDGTLRVAVSEAPEDGRASRAVCDAVARAFGVAPSAVTLRRGMASRSKHLLIAGDPARLEARARELLA